MMEHRKEINSARVLPSLKGMTKGRTNSGFGYGTLGDGPDLLLLPGFGATHAAWAPLVSELQGTFRLILVDLPGTGRNARLRPGGGVNQMIAPLDALLDHLGLGRIAILGASMGGMTALWFARNHPERVRRLVVAGSMARVEPSEQARMDERIALLRKGGAHAFARAMVGDLLAPAFVKAHPRLVRAVSHAYALELPPPEEVERLAGILRGLDLRPHLGEITAPTLVLHGEADRLVAVRQAEYLADRLVDARLLVLEGAGHHVLLEKRRESIRAIKSFLTAAD